ncbi:hypothetical protein BC828DRAFT_387488 [Blastocladiella britannica]|nr:hypothetical protein BC828DRAFT_387488 [Blastocladiella britannica]
MATTATTIATTTPQKLVPFLLLAKSSRGAAAADLAIKAAEAPGVYSFAELLSVPSIAALEASHPPVHRALSLFAYGTLADYHSQLAANAVPPLSPAMLHKLRLLTLTDLAHQHRLIPYAVLLDALCLADESAVRDLEDLIIEAIYEHILKATIDQQRRELLVESAVGRDVHPTSVPLIASALRQWAHNTDLVLGNINDRIHHVKSVAAAKASAEAKALADPSSSSSLARGGGKHKHANANPSWAAASALPGLRGFFA